MEKVLGFRASYYDKINKYYNIFNLGTFGEKHQKEKVFINSL
jgi:hypothetical protein